ncbi:MAG TPA: ATP phosphoribosyltransferase regulatory subunit [Polyangiaceae bacterium]
MRDLLPPEAHDRAELGREVVRCFELHGYEIVTVPLFEFADVVERGLTGLPQNVLRFVEPESGAIVSLRPDMTPQVARIVATRLGDAPVPARLCYLGSVLRRRRERARRHVQISQAGIELVGQSGPEGDLEVLNVAAATARAAGLRDFVLDLGHARIAGALVEALEPARAREILDALEVKDDSEVVRRAAQHGLGVAERRALAALPTLHGGAEVWPKARAALEGTAAAVALAELQKLWDAARASELAPNILVDLAETRDLAYYTGALFHIYAEGPGRAIGSGGRYDGLLGRFGAPRPAVGFAFGLDDLAWALDFANQARSSVPKLLAVGLSQQLAGALRARGVAVAPAPESDALNYARAWRYSHLLENRAGVLTLIDVVTGHADALASNEDEAVTTLAARLSPAR